MLGKRNRLTRVEVEKTFKTGSFFRGKASVVRSIPSLTTRIAVSVPKKIAKTAVIRNRLRRLVYQACEKQSSFDALRRDVVFSLNSTDIDGVLADVDAYFVQLTK